MVVNFFNQVDKINIQHKAQDIEENKENTQRVKLRTLDIDLIRRVKKYRD